MSIDDLRRRIDGIDDELLDLLDRRAHVTREIAQEKWLHGVVAHDPERERKIVERLENALEARADAAFPKSSVAPVFREVMSACLSLEEPQTVAYMGPSGTFSHIAAHSAFGLAARYIETPTIGAVLEAVARGSANYGVAPIENSTEGGVTATLDAFLELDVMIQREFVIEVTQCLLGRERDLGKIRRVYSHPQPLAQCRAWLSRHLPHAELVTSPSTAVAAREAASEEYTAAIGSRLSAQLYSLEIIQESIQDRAENATRFVVVAKSDAERTGRDKTSVAFSAAHVRGALRRALEIFDDEGLNLTRIESRPAAGRRWEYVFFTDFEGHRTDANVAKAIDRLRHACSTVRVLGSYPRNDSP
ncbi:MAG TPA: prephenate dehydratase [Polyangiaceae bacterium]|nr:prephenate dehydratase [Polyangiaceae bacterium]